MEQGQRAERPTTRCRRAARRRAALPAAPRSLAPAALRRAAWRARRGARCRGPAGGTSRPSGEGPRRQRLPHLVMAMTGRAGVMGHHGVKHRGAAAGARGVTGGQLVIRKRTGGRRRGGCWSKARPGWPVLDVHGNAIPEPQFGPGGCHGGATRNVRAVLPRDDLGRYWPPGGAKISSYSVLQEAGTPTHLGWRHLTRPPHMSRSRRAARFPHE